MWSLQKVTYNIFLLIDIARGSYCVNFLIQLNAGFDKYIAYVDLLGVICLIYDNVGIFMVAFCFNALFY